MYVFLAILTGMAGYGVQQSGRMITAALLSQLLGIYMEYRHVYGAIQVLRNADGGWGVSSFPTNSVTKV